MIERFTPADRSAHWLTGDHMGRARGHGPRPLARQGADPAPLIGYTLFSWLADTLEGPAQLPRPGADRRGAVDVHPLHPQQRRWRRGRQVVRRTSSVTSRGTNIRAASSTPARSWCSGWSLVVVSTVLVVTGLILRLPELRSDAADDAVRQHRPHGRGVRRDRARVRAHLPRHDRHDRRVPRNARRLRRRSWAEHHHARWYREVVAGTAREKFVQPAAVVLAGAAARRPA